MFTHEDLILAL